MLIVFTALHAMQTRSSDENSVCPPVRPSVCLFVCQTRGLWQNGKKICPDFYTIRRIIFLVFWSFTSRLLKIWTKLSSVLSQSTRLTDRQTAEFSSLDRVCILRSTVKTDKLDEALEDFTKALELNCFLLVNLAPFISYCGLLVTFLFSTVGTPTSI